MKNRYIYIILILISAVTVNATAEDSRKASFAEGVSLYTAGSYDKALEKWLEIYNTGYRSAELEYNIGNAYFKLNNTAGAILFFERARLLAPADEDINYNLQIARTLIVDRFDEIPELFFVRWWNVTSLFLKSNTWAVISLLSFIFFLLGLSLYLFSSEYRLKVTGFWVAIALLLVSLISMSLSFRSRQLVYDTHKAIIFAPQVTGKSSPDVSGNVLFELHEGTKVTTGEKVGEWYEIRLSDGNKGWVPASSLEII